MVVRAAVLAAVVSMLAPDEAARVRYDGHQVVRTWPTDVAELRAILEIADDVWTERPGIGPLDIRVSPAARARLDALGIDYDLRIADVQVAVDAERQRLTAASDPASAGPWFSDFKDAAAIDAYLDTLAGEVPDIVTVESVGQSLDGRPIRALKITAGDATGKAAILYTGTMHAREWLSPMTVTCIADTLARSYGSDPRITDILDQLVVYVIPVINPDGYAYSWQVDRYWRKNTRGGYGVDLNRNFGYAWGGDGSSSYQGDETYAGSGPFSEPESQAVAAYVESKPELVAHIDFHSFAELVLYPWGNQYGPAPDEGTLSQLAGQMSAAIQAETGYYFAPIQGSDLYPASGVIDDWSYGERGLMAFTIEMRGDDFVISPSQIDDSCDENLGAALELAEWATQSSDVPEDPDDGGGGSDGGGDDHGGVDDHGGDDDHGGGDDGGTGDGGGDDGDDGDDASGGTAGGDADGGGDDDGGDADDGDDAGQHGPGALPPGYGYGAEPGACACRSRRETAGAWVPVLLGLLALARRRRR